MRALRTQTKAGPCSLLVKLRAAAALFSTSEVATLSDAGSFVSRAATAASSDGGATVGSAAAEHSSAGSSQQQEHDLLMALLQLPAWQRRRSMRLEDFRAALDRAPPFTAAADAARAGAAAAPAAAAQLVPPDGREPRLISSELRSATSCQRVAELLLRERHSLTHVHLEQALSRVGRLVREARRAAAEDEQEIFLGAREVLFDMLAQEGRQLSMGAACHLLCASTSMRLPLSPEQQEAIEAVVVPQLPSASAKHIQELLSSYLRLGMRPGPQLAAWLTPPLCRLGGAAVAGARPGPPANWGADAAAATSAGGQPQPQLQPLLSPELLSKELARAARLGQHTYLLRLLLHHADMLNSVHLFIALEALAQVRLQGAVPADAAAAATAARSASAAAGSSGSAAAATAAVAGGTSRDAAAAASAVARWEEVLRRGQRPRQMRSVLIDTFCTLREIAVEVAELEHLESDAAMMAARCLLHTSAATRQPLQCAAQQAAVEAVTARGLVAADSSDLGVVAQAYAELGMRPGSALLEAAVVAAERVLATASPRELQLLLPAWRQCGWPVTDAMQSAAELAALTSLDAAMEATEAAEWDEALARSGPGSSTATAAAAAASWQDGASTGNGGGGSSSGGGGGGGGGRSSSSGGSGTASRQQRTLARQVAQLLEAFGGAEWPLGPTLTADLQTALARCIPAATGGLAARLLASCLRLRLLPDPNLSAAFLHTAVDVLPGAKLHDAAAFAARLLGALRHQGWRYQDAPPEEQAAVDLTLATLADWVQYLQTPGQLPRSNRGHLDLKREVGQLCRMLRSMAALGVRPPEGTLAAACAVLQRNADKLWQKERQWLHSAFTTWQYPDHGLVLLGASNGLGSSSGSSSSSPGRRRGTMHGGNGGSSNGSSSSDGSSSSSSDDSDTEAGSFPVRATAGTLVCPSEQDGSGWQQQQHCVATLSERECAGTLPL